MKQLLLLTLFLLSWPVADARAAEDHDHGETIVVKIATLDEAVNAVAFFQREIDSHLEKGELAKVHTSAFAARDAASSATAFAGTLPEEARRELATRVARIGEIAVQLDKYGDAGKGTETGVFARRLREESEALQRLTGVTIRPDYKPEVVATAEGGHGASRCPHKARHGGRFSLALNDAYHLEGVYPSPGEFRLYFYDHESCEIPADRFTGRLLFQNGEHRLEQSADGTHLRAVLPGAPQPPVSMTAILDIPHPETGKVSTEHFSYNFYRLSKPAAATTDQATTGTRAH